MKRSIDVLMDRASEDAERAVRRALEGLRVEVRRAAGPPRRGARLRRPRRRAERRRRARPGAHDGRRDRGRRPRRAAGRGRPRPRRAARRRGRPARAGDRGGAVGPRTCARSTTCASCRSAAATSCRCTSSSRAALSLADAHDTVEQLEARGPRRRCRSCGWSTPTSSRSRGRTGRSKPDARGGRGGARGPIEEVVRRYTGQDAAAGALPRRRARPRRAHHRAAAARPAAAVARTGGRGRSSAPCASGAGSLADVIVHTEPAPGDDPPRSDAAPAPGPSTTSG